jgi:hypothetical protein
VVAGGVGDGVGVVAVRNCLENSKTGKSEN